MYYLMPIIKFIYLMGLTGPSIRSKDITSARMAATPAKTPTTAYRIPAATRTGQRHHPVEQKWY